MKKVVKHLNALLVVMWFFATAMWMGGEPKGSFIEQIVVGFISFALMYIYASAMARHDLIITSKDDNDNDRK